MKKQAEYSGGSDIDRIDFDAIKQKVSENETRPADSKQEDNNCPEPEHCTSTMMVVKK